MSLRLNTNNNSNMKKKHDLLTQEQAEKFFLFLKEKLNIRVAQYARTVHISRYTAYWQIKNNKVRRDQAVAFLSKYFEKLHFLI